VASVETIGTILVVAVAVVHVYILWLEMFAWTRPRVRAIFGTTREFAQASRTLAANQGLYNGFLAAGLLWGALAGELGVKVFFLLCVAVAGLYGGATANRRIVIVQTVPAVVALFFVILGG
jgi:putative membrane protein